MISAKIIITYHVNTTTVTQRVTIQPNKKSHLKYLLNNKYIAGHKLEDKLRRYYIGDGENLIFQKEARHKNVLAFTYKIIGELKRDFKSVEFNIFAQVPTEHLCLSCRYYRENYKRCLYYKKMHIEFKKHCVSYEQQDK